MIINCNCYRMELNLNKFATWQKLDYCKKSPPYLFMEHFRRAQRDASEISALQTYLL